MICKNCGAELHENALFCGNCGMKAEAEPAPAPVVEPIAEPAPKAGEYKAEFRENFQEQGSYVPPVQPQYTEPAPSAPYVGAKPNTVLWIVLSAVEMLCCCQISGIISLILSILAHVSADKGDFPDADQKLKYAKLSFWLGFALTIIFLVVYLIFVLLMTAGVVSGVAGIEDLYGYSYYY